MKISQNKLQLRNKKKKKKQDLKLINVITPLEIG